MDTSFSLHIDSWADGDPIPAKFAFGTPGSDTPFAPSDNLNPELRWSNAPAGTKSFAILCHDPDVPSVADDVNQDDRTVPEELPRMDFFHWVLVDIPADISSIEEGAASQGITPGGKSAEQTPCGIIGKNDYSAWFAADPDMGGVYMGYDGPCPPWNDSIVHHYHFEVFALDVESLGLKGEFSGQEAREAMQSHILAQASHMGTYSMNPDVTA